MHYLFRGAIVGVAAVLVFSLTAIGRVHHVPSRDEIHSASAPVALIGIIEIPSNPLLSSDIAWVGIRDTEILLV